MQLLLQARYHTFPKHEQPVCQIIYAVNVCLAEAGRIAEALSDKRGLAYVDVA